MRVLLYETRTGKPIRDLQRSAWEYDTGILAPDTASVTVPAYTRWAEGIALREELTPLKHSIALVDESVEGVRRVPAAGVLLPPEPVNEADGNQAYKCSIRGVEMLLQLRSVKKFPGWPLIGSNGKPTGTYDQSFENQSYGTIIKKLVQESELFAGGDLPIIYEADRAGVHSRTQYAAINGKPILEAMDDIAELDDGIEYDFQPVIDEYDNISFKLVTGTDSGRVIVPNDSMIWNLGGARPDIIDWDPNAVIDDLTTDAYFTGGKAGDKVLIARATDSTLVDDGWPRVERWDQSHSTVEKLGTLQAWADGAINAGYRRFNFKVRADRAHGLRHGDRVQLAVDGHWDEPAGVTAYRVVSVSRESGDPDWVKVQLA